MNFCKECDSMLLPEQIDNKLWLKCSECGYKEQNVKTIIETKNYKSKDTVLVDNNKYIIYDNTLPNSTHKECANKDCLSRKDPLLQNCKIIQDPITIKLTFKCIVCKTEWSYS